jgi:hypothetical protein
MHLKMSGDLYDDVACWYGEDERGDDGKGY